MLFSYLHLFVAVLLCAATHSLAQRDLTLEGPSNGPGLDPQTGASRDVHHLAGGLDSLTFTIRGLLGQTPEPVETVDPPGLSFKGSKPAPKPAPKPSPKPPAKPKSSSSSSDDDDDDDDDGGSFSRNTPTVIILGRDTSRAGRDASSGSEESALGPSSDSDLDLDADDLEGDGAKSAGVKTWKNTGHVVFAVLIATAIACGF